MHTCITNYVIYKTYINHTYCKRAVVVCSLFTGLRCVVSVAVLMKFWTPKIYSKCWRNFGQYFVSYLNYFPAPKNISWEITYGIQCSSIIWQHFEITIFAEISENCGKNIWKLQSLGPKKLKTFVWNIDGNFGEHNNTMCSTLLMGECKLVVTDSQL